MQAKRASIVIFIILLLSPTLFIGFCRADIVEADWADSIDSYCLEVDSNTTAEIVVCVFPSLYGHGITDKSGNEIHDIVQLGVHIFNDEALDVLDGTQTGIGKSGKDNGVLLVVAIQEREYRFEVGYGLEGDITDIETGLIAQQYLVPAFQNENYGEGLYDTVVALGEQIPASTETAPVRGYYYYESDATPEPTQTPFWLIDFYGWPLWAIILLAIVGVFVPVFGRSVARGGGRSGGGGSTGRW